MATVNIIIPDAIIPEINDIATAQGFANPRDWLISVIRGYLANERTRKAEVRPDREAIRAQVEADLP